MSRDISAAVLQYTSELISQPVADSGAYMAVRVRYATTELEYIA